MSSFAVTPWRDPADRETDLPKRPLGRALWRGFRRRCPHCGEGKLFKGYLKPVMACADCGEDLSHQRADDAPPYFTILIVGHIVVPLMVVVTLTSELSDTTHIAIWVPLTLVLTLLLLRPIKGAIIALQWALRMHGFDGQPDPDRFDRAFADADASDLHSPRQAGFSTE